MRAITRPLAVLLASLSLAVVPAGATRAAAPTPHAAAVDLSAFEGDWTPDKAANEPVTGNPFSITELSSSPESDVGPNNKANFERYCGPDSNTNITYFVITYSWTPGPSDMGGCHSNATEQHIYFWGSNSDYGYVYQAKVDGESVLKGQWNFFDAQGKETKHNLVAHRAVVNFITNIKLRSATRKHLYQETEISGLGEVRLEARPAEGCGATAWQAVATDGSLEAEQTRIGGPNIIEVYDLTLTFEKPTTGNYSICPDGPSHADGIPFTVTKSDPTEKDLCVKGSTGTLSLDDRDAKDGGDVVKLSIPKCKIDSTLNRSTLKKGEHARVVLDLNRNGY